MISNNHCPLLDFQLTILGAEDAICERDTSLELGHHRFSFSTTCYLATAAIMSAMESFESIYLDLSKQPGKCRIAEKGLGWKPSGGGDTFTLDASNIAAAQWSRAAKGYEVKVLSRTDGVIQLDGFELEVRA